MNLRSDHRALPYTQTSMTPAPNLSFKHDADSKTSWSRCKWMSSKGGAWLGPFNCRWIAENPKSLLDWRMQSVSRMSKQNFENRTVSMNADWVVKPLPVVCLHSLNQWKNSHTSGSDSGSGLTTTWWASDLVEACHLKYLRNVAARFKSVCGLFRPKLAFSVSLASLPLASFNISVANISPTPVANQLQESSSNHWPQASSSCLFLFSKYSRSLMFRTALSKQASLGTCEVEAKVSDAWMTFSMNSLSGSGRWLCGNSSNEPFPKISAKTPLSHGSKSDVWCWENWPWFAMTPNCHWESLVTGCTTFEVESKCNSEPAAGVLGLGQTESQALFSVSPLCSNVSNESKPKLWGFANSRSPSTCSSE